MNRKKNGNGLNKIKLQKELDDLILELRSIIRSRYRSVFQYLKVNGKYTDSYIMQKAEEDLTKCLNRELDYRIFNAEISDPWNNAISRYFILEEKIRLISGQKKKRISSDLSIIEQWMRDQGITKSDIIKDFRTICDRLNVRPTQEGICALIQKAYPDYTIGTIRQYFMTWRDGR